MNDDGFLELYHGDALKIASELLVDEDDVGTLAQCLVVVQYNNKVGDYREPSNFMLSEQGWKEASLI